MPEVTRNDAGELVVDGDRYTLISETPTHAREQAEACDRDARTYERRAQCYEADADVATQKAGEAYETARGQVGARDTFLAIARFLEAEQAAKPRPVTELGALLVNADRNLSLPARFIDHRGRVYRIEQVSQDLAHSSTGSHVSKVHLTLRAETEAQS